MLFRSLNSFRPLYFRRVFAATVDTLLNVIPFVIGMIFADVIPAASSSEGLILFIGFLASFTLLLFKDYSGRSLGKRIFGLKVVNFVTKEVSTGRKNVLRNLLMFLWPLESVCMMFMNPYRKIMDRVLGLDVVLTS